MKPEVGQNLAKAAAKVLKTDAERTTSSASSTQDSASRTKTIAAMAGVLRQRKQKKRARFIAISSSLAVAAVIVLAIGGRAVLRGNSGASASTSAPVPTPPMVAASFVKGSPVVVRGTEQLTVTDGVPLRAGDHLSVKPGSRMTVGFAQGTHVAIDDHAELDMTSAAPTTAFQLTSGSVRADVAKLFQGERFIIRTSDAEVEVHGTSFEVIRVDDSDPSSCNKKTRVRVREGVVAVRSEGKETFVRANEVWPTCEATTTANASNPSATTTTSNVAAAPQRPATVAGQQPHPSSDLAAQNDLFEAAISKKRAGDTRGAITAFEDLLARYPQSHLAQSARAERMKLLRTIDRDRAKLAAQDYLKRYPAGFARKDAEVILEEK